MINLKKKYIQGISEMLQNKNFTFLVPLEFAQNAYAL